MQDHKIMWEAHRRLLAQRAMPDRLRNATLSDARTNVKPIIGVDIDGVIADQVSGVLERANAAYNLSVSYDDVTNWDVVLGPSSFVPEIRKAMMSPEYVLGMRVHDGADQMLAELRKDFAVHLLTVRPSEVAERTKEWLVKNSLPFDELIIAKEALKGEHGTQALVDDFPGNVAQFIDTTDGPAVLVDQPWNRQTPELDEAFASGRVTRVARLRAVPDVLRAELL